VQAPRGSSIIRFPFAGKIPVRFLILSDIHASLTALEAALAAAEGFPDSPALREVAAAAK